MKINNKVVTGILLVILFIILFIILINNHSKKSYSIDDNQIIYKNIGDEEMAEIYFSDFMNSIEMDTLEAYKLLDNSKISYDDFLTFIDEIYSYDNDEDYVRIKSFKVKKNDDYKLFYIKDNFDRTYIFKENSIMDYTVYLNENDIR